MIFISGIIKEWHYIRHRADYQTQEVEPPEPQTWGLHGARRNGGLGSRARAMRKQGVVKAD